MTTRNGVPVIEQYKPFWYGDRLYLPIDIEEKPDLEANTPGKTLLTLYASGQVIVLNVVDVPAKTALMEPKAIAAPEPEMLERDAYARRIADYLGSDGEFYRVFREGAQKTMRRRWINGAGDHGYAGWRSPPLWKQYVAEVHVRLKRISGHLGARMDPTTGTWNHAMSVAAILWDEDFARMKQGDFGPVGAWGQKAF